eukprot:m.59484 g.59484  ORF g.59484 m.59484 type:complete len:84 (+) comp12987_c0_seq1:1920-2171(+)
MGLSTVAYFTAGGLFTAVYSNGVRHLPLLRKPKLHLACTGVGFALGMAMHFYEEKRSASLPQVLGRQVQQTATLVAPLQSSDE